MERTLLIYQTPSGKSPFSDWLSGMKDSKARAVIRARLERIQLGNFGDCKSVGDGVSELRIPYGPGYRVYFGRQGETIVVLLCGGNKGTQQKILIKPKYYGRSTKMPTKNYHNELIKQLKNPKEAAEYLNACFEDSEEVFLAGLKNVVEARGGVSAVARATKLNRENLYRALSKKGNPKLSSLSTILEALGIELQFAPAKKHHKQGA